MLRNRGWVLAAGVAMAMAAAPAVRAEVVIDQPTANAAFQVNFHEPMGQSFTAVTDNLQSIGVELHNFNVWEEWLSDRILTMTVFSGEGFGGPVLATADVDVAALLGDATGAKAFVSFGFTGLSITPGHAYTFGLTDPTPRYGISLAVGANPYAGGRSFYNPHVEEPIASDIQMQTDLLFSISAAVPEPGSVLLMVCGLAALASLRWRPRPG